MPNNDFNFIATIISIISIIIATTSCYMTYKQIKLSLRPYVSLYLISSQNATYVKIKNFGKTNAVIDYFETDVNLNEYLNTVGYHFSYVGLSNITLGPSQSKIASFDKNYLNSNHWIKVSYHDDKGKKYVSKLQLNTYKEFALVNDKDFDFIDY